MLYLVKFKSELVKQTVEIPIVSSRVDFGKYERVNQVRLANYANELSGK